MRLGEVSLGWSLLWFAIILAGRETMLWIRPRASHVQLAAGSALLVLFTDLNLEPVVRQSRLLPPVASVAECTPPAAVYAYLEGSTSAGPTRTH